VQHSYASEWSPTSGWRRTLSLLVLLSLVAAAASLSIAAPARADGGPLPVLVATPAAGLPAVPVAATAAPPAPTQLVVTFKSGASSAAVKSTLADAAVTQVGTITLSGAAIVAVPELAASSALVTLKADPDVASARIDPPVQAVLSPNDPYYDGDRPASTCVNSLSCWPYQELGLPAAWDATTGSTSVVVAVIDTGVDGLHQELSGSVLAGWDFVHSVAIPADSNSDDYGHGTEVAGTIASHGNNGVGIAGACWNCKILPIKVLDSNGSGATSTVANGIVWAVDHGANIINLSLAGPGGDPAYVTALNYAVAHGVLVVIAAGNSGSNLPNVCNGQCGGYPAYYAKDIPGVISVGAMNYNSDLYSFSNFGSWVEVAAPGCVVAVTMDGSYQPNGVCGTSIASPWVAGAAALALSYDPSLTPAQLETAIESTASLTLPSTRLLNDGSGVSCGGLCTGSGAVNVKALLQSLGASYNPPALTSPPTLAGTAQVGSILTGTDGSFSGSGGTITLSHVWLRCDASGNNCSPISGATASTYMLVQADVGATLRFQTTATDSNGASSENSDATAVVIGAVPGNTTVPTISGSTAVGDTLSASTGSWSNSPTSYGYEWLRDGSAINGATSSSYTVADADVGHTLSVRVTATNAGGSGSADSAATGSVPMPTPAVPGNTTLPTISGSTAVGDTLSASTGSWSNSPTYYGYEWLRDGSAIDGATGSSYQLVDADVGHALSVRVTATNAGGSSSADSAATGSVLVPTPAVPGNTTLPTISGSTAVGDTLSASTGSWSNSPTSYGYQWLRDGSVIDGATSSSYTIADTDAGHTLSVRVTATNADGQTAATSLAAGPVADSTPTPVVTPPAPAPSSSSGGSGGSSLIPPQLTLSLDVSASTVTLGGQVGYTIIVFSKNAGSATNVHLIVNLPAGATMALGSASRGSGCTQSGQTIDCNLDWLSPPLTAQVQLVVSFASAGAFTIPFAVGEQQIDADPSDNQLITNLTVGYAKTILAAPEPVQPQQLQLVARPKIVGTARVGQLLVASVGQWQGTRITYSYSWSRCDANGSHCTTLKTHARSYQLQIADSGKTILVIVTATNATGSQQARSLASKPVIATAKQIAAAKKAAAKKRR